MFDTIKNLWNKTNRWHRVTFILLIEELGLLPERNLGFYCKDPALSHVFIGDTVTWKWLLLTTCFLPLSVMLVVEIKYNHEMITRTKNNALKWYNEFCFGLMVNLTVVQMVKIFVGAPRPHFFDTCRPLEAETCQPMEYVSEYTCTKMHWLSRSNQSFPSGHASMAVHTALFTIWYLQYRMKEPSCWVYTKLIQLVLTVGAIICCATRVMDHRHHVRDVVAGALFAIITAGLTVHYLCKDFEVEESDELEVEGDEDEDDDEDDDDDDDDDDDYQDEVLTSLPHGSGARSRVRIMDSVLSG